MALMQAKPGSAGTKKAGCGEPAFSGAFDTVA